MLEEERYYIVQALYQLQLVNKTNKRSTFNTVGYNVLFIPLPSSIELDTFSSNLSQCFDSGVLVLHIVPENNDSWVRISPSQAVSPNTSISFPRSDRLYLRDLHRTNHGTTAGASKLYFYQQDTVATNGENKSGLNESSQQRTSEGTKTVGR